MTQILPNLYLGDIDDTYTAKIIWKRNIRCIINCTIHEKNYLQSAKDPWKIQYYRVPVNDDLKRKSILTMRRFLPETLEKISCILKQGYAVLVHCQRGRQRSACVVAAFLMKSLNLSDKEAVDFVRHKRPAAFTPFVNFALCLTD